LGLGKVSSRAKEGLAGTDVLRPRRLNRDILKS
jgi:hypothetical protein